MTAGRTARPADGESCRFDGEEVTATDPARYVCGETTDIPVLPRKGAMQYELWALNT